MSKLSAALVSLGLLAHTAMAAQMRSRSEGVPGVIASNTVGLGDIWVTAGASTYFRIRPVANEVLAATMPGKWAAPPAPAMMTRTPRVAALPPKSSIS